MRCPKCSFISFDQQQSCPKCGADWTGIVMAYQGTGQKTIPPFFLGAALSTPAETEASGGDVATVAEEPREGTAALFEALETESQQIGLASEETAAEMPEFDLSLAEETGGEPPGEEFAVDLAGLGGEGQQEIELNIGEEDTTPAEAVDTIDLAEPQEEETLGIELNLDDLTPPAPQVEETAGTIDLAEARQEPAGEIELSIEEPATPAAAMEAIDLAEPQEEEAAGAIDLAEARPEPAGEIELSIEESAPPAAAVEAIPPAESQEGEEARELELNLEDLTPPAPRAEETVALAGPDKQERPAPALDLEEIDLSDLIDKKSAAGKSSAPHSGADDEIFDLSLLMDDEPGSSATAASPKKQTPLESSGLKLESDEG